MLTVTIQKDGVVVLNGKFENLTVTYKNYEFEESRTLTHCTNEKDFHSMWNIAEYMRQFAYEKLQEFKEICKVSNSEYNIETPIFDRALEFKLAEYTLEVSDDDNNNRTMIDQQANLIILTGVQKDLHSEKDSGQALVKLLGVSSYHEWCFVMGAALEIQSSHMNLISKLSKNSRPSGAS